MNTLSVNNGNVSSRADKNNLISMILILKTKIYLVACSLIHEQVTLMKRLFLVNIDTVQRNHCMH